MNTYVKPAAKMTGGNDIGLNHFVPAEFGKWWGLMSPELLRKLDKFRELWGDKVMISPVSGAIGRHLGHDDTSQHNVDKWGEVRGIDIFPKGLNASTKAKAIRCAKKAGFTGYGIYSDTKPSWMMHVDVRADRTVSRPATWGRVSDAKGSKRYVGLGEVV